MIMQVYLYTYLCPRNICVTKAASAVPIGVSEYGHSSTSRATIRNKLKGDMVTYIQEPLDHHSSSHWNAHALNMSRHNEG